MFPRFQKLPIEAEGDLIPIDVVGIKRHGVFRPLVWETVVSAHGEWAGRDKDHRSTIESSTRLDRRNRLPALRGLWLTHPKTDYPCHEADPSPQHRPLSTHCCSIAAGSLKRATGMPSVISATCKP